MFKLPKRLAFGPCKGWLLFAIGKYKIELWCAPLCYTIPVHKHPNENIEIMFLLGKNVIFGRTDVGSLCLSSPKNTFRCMTIKHFHEHFFATGMSKCWFLSFAKWVGKPNEMTTANNDIIFKGKDY